MQSAVSNQLLVKMTDFLSEKVAAGYDTKSVITQILTKKRKLFSYQLRPQSQLALSFRFGLSETLKAHKRFM